MDSIYLKQICSVCEQELSTDYSEHAHIMEHSDGPVRCVCKKCYDSCSVIEQGCQFFSTYKCKLYSRTKTHTNYFTLEEYKRLKKAVQGES